MTDDGRRGVACSYFNYRGDVTQAVNSITSAATDPINPIYRFKLGRGRVVGRGPSEYRDSIISGCRNRVS